MGHVGRKLLSFFQVKRLIRRGGEIYGGTLVRGSTREEMARLEEMEIEELSSSPGREQSRQNC